MILPPIIQQQLKHDTPYAWFLRHQASSSPIFMQHHLAELDNRLEAYLDCYLISEKSGQSLLPQLNSEDWGALFVMALIALRSNNTKALTTAINNVENEQHTKELSDALCWVNAKTAIPHLPTLLEHENTFVRVAGVIVGGFFTEYFKQKTLQSILNDKAPEVIAASLKVIGENKLRGYEEAIKQHLTHENEAVRFQAAYSANLLRLPNSLSALQRFCFTETSYLREALALLYQVVPETAIEEALNRIQKSNLSPRIKSYNIAMAGLPNAIPILLEWMKDPEYAPLAGEAFSFITGVDIEEDDLSIRHVELCESQEAPLAEKRKQDPWTEDYEDDLPWPDPELVKHWWNQYQHHFHHGTRYLAGKTLTVENMEQVLQTGTQPQRHIANLILSIKNPSRIIKTVRGKAI